MKKIAAQLAAGKNVVVTSGFLRAMQDRGFKDIAEWETTGNVASIHDFLNGFGAGNGNSLNDPKHDNPAILFPEVRFLTNDSWGIIRGVAGSKGFPILLMNRYSKGVITLLTIPENVADLYNLPQGAITQIKHYLQRDFPVQLDAPPLVSLFAYDNDTFVVESFKAGTAEVNISIAGANMKLRDVTTGKLVAMQKPPKVAPDPRRRAYQEPSRTVFPVKIAPHSYQVYKIEK